MDSLFDDKSYDVGAEIEAYCPNPRCRGDTVHVINSMYENEIRKVTCTVCNDAHAFRKPRGIPFDDSGEPPTPTKVARPKKKPTWEEAMATVTELELAACRPYSTLDTYVHLDVVSHPTFGVGFVTELLPDNKVEISFKEEPKILVHRRAAGQFNQTVSQMPAPRQRARRRRRKKGPDTSDIAHRLLSERMLANTKSKDFAEVSDAKLEAAEKAAEYNRRLALEIVAEKIAQGLELTPAEQSAAKDASQLVKEAAKQRAADERERARLEREKEKERKRLEREKEKEKERARKEREKEKERKRLERQKEKDRLRLEKERARSARDKDRAAKERQKEQERLIKEREKVRLNKQRDRDRAMKKAAADRMRKQREDLRRKAAAQRARLRSGAKTASARRTGGKKTTAPIRRTGGKKTIAWNRRR